VGTTKNIIGIILERKFDLFGDICRIMEDTRLVKNVVFGIMEGTSKGGRPNQEWLDDIKGVFVEECFDVVDDFLQHII